MLKIEQNAEDLWTVIRDGRGEFAGTLDECVRHVKASVGPAFDGCGNP
jgi:hypothetical protein